MDKLKEQLCNNIWAALDDYFRHADSDDVYENISEQFVERLASDSIKAKSSLRQLFRKSQGWNENLQAIVINGTKTHNPDYTLVHDLANSILRPAKWDADCDKLTLIDRAICFFSRPNDKDDSYINAINELAPHAYAPRKKRSRIFKAICDSLGVSDLSAGSEFQHLFAQFADELSTKKIDFKLFLSINPAHFLTMSNPKRDDRGSTLTSCHSFNVIDCEYNCGCSGYARDDVTFIVFTASNPDNPETLNNRKTTRQLFMYKPQNGLLLQSRLYNTHGGTCGTQAESKLYRDLVQREISELEGVPNLWKTEKYCGNKHNIHIPCGNGFGGYADWTHPDFDAKTSIRQDHEHDFQIFNVGTYGLCISCADELSSKLLCSDCDHDGCEFCQECENYCSETWDVINRHGERIHVCESCLDEYYRLCEHCDEYFPREQISTTGDASHVCHNCLENDYLLCSECDEYFLANELSLAVDENGNNVYICDSCRDNFYILCNECEKLFHKDFCHHCKAEEVPA
ncbi:MAG: hypothetical protein IJG33_15710 [Selenomonadaceae bacterium]|nr:hypothetical protein [Selenomonadaceae bacterium]